MAGLESDIQLELGKPGIFARWLIILGNLTPPPPPFLKSVCVCAYILPSSHQEVDLKTAVHALFAGMPILESSPVSWAQFWASHPTLVGIDTEGNQRHPPVLVQIATDDLCILEAPTVQHGLSSGLVLSCLVLSCLVLSCLVLPCLALPCLALPCLALPCLVLCFVVLCCLVLSCVVLCCLVLSCLIVSCLALPCLVLACLVLSWTHMFACPCQCVPPSPTMVFPTISPVVLCCVDLCCVVLPCVVLPCLAVYLLDLRRVLADDTIVKVFCDNFSHHDKTSLGLPTPSDMTTGPIVDLEFLAAKLMGATKVARGLPRIVSRAMPGCAREYLCCVCVCVCVRGGDQDGFQAATFHSSLMASFEYSFVYQ